MSGSTSIKGSAFASVFSDTSSCVYGTLATVGVLSCMAMPVLVPASLSLVALQFVVCAVCMHCSSMLHSKYEYLRKKGKIEDNKVNHIIASVMYNFGILPIYGVTAYFANSIGSFVSSWLGFVLVGWYGLHTHGFVTDMLMETIDEFIVIPAASACCNLLDDTKGYRESYEETSDEKDEEVSGVSGLIQSACSSFCSSFRDQPRLMLRYFINCLITPFNFASLSYSERWAMVPGRLATAMAGTMILKTIRSCFDKEEDGRTRFNSIIRAGAVGALMGVFIGSKVMISLLPIPCLVLSAVSLLLSSLAFSANPIVDLIEAKVNAGSVVEKTSDIEATV